MVYDVQISAQREALQPRDYTERLGVKGSTTTDSFLKDSREDGFGFCRTMSSVRVLETRKVGRSS
jgi:hypothetical protein